MKEDPNKPTTVEDWEIAFEAQVDHHEDVVKELKGQIRNLTKERDEYKKGRDDVFKQVTDLSEVRETIIAAANKFSKSNKT